MNHSASQQQTLTIPQAINMAVQLQNAGRLQEAEAIYNQILQVDPNNAEVLSLVGFLSLQSGKNEAAVELLKKAISVKTNTSPENVPQNWYAWLGIALAKLNRFDEAGACVEKKDIDPQIRNPFFDQLTSILVHTGHAPILEKIGMRNFKEFRNRPDIKLLNQLGVCFIGESHTFNIGLMSYLDMFLKAGILGWHSHKNPILLVNERCPNQCYLNYWRHYLPAMISDPVVKQRLSPISSKTEGGGFYRTPDGRLLHEIEASTEIQRQWKSEKRDPLLTLSDSDEERGRACLQKMEAPRNVWFVGLHVREQTEGGYCTRNAAISNYRMAMKTITERGGWIIRMGGPSMTTLDPMDHVIDYVHTKFKSDWMDVFLWAKCRFFLGTQSGPAAIPLTFGVPSIMTDVIPLSDRPWFNDLFIPKLIWSERENRHLTFAEVISSPVGHALWPSVMDSEGCKIIDNSPEEINDLVLEMLDVLDGTQTYTEEDEHLQERFNNLEANVHREHQKIQGIARMGQKFIRKYEYLLP